MKKLTFIILSLLSIGFLFGEGKITILEPNSLALKLTLGSPYRIRWKQTGIFKNRLKIVLLKEGKKVGTIAETINQYQKIPDCYWQVGKLKEGTAAPGKHYRIKIREKNTKVMALSMPFEILTDQPPPSRLHPPAVEKNGNTEPPKISCGTHPIQQKNSAFY